MIAASGRFDLPFTCVDSTGAPTAPTGTPTGTLVKNGTDLGTTVTVSMTGAQGIASCTIPSDAAVGDSFYIRLSAVISGVTYVVAGPSETVDKTVDSRATQTSLDAVDDLLDTEIAAIKAKTDNLPTDPADQSAVELAITSATASLATASALATLTGYVDTEVAAIKAKTDQLTFTTSNVVDASPTPATNIRSAMGLASANLDTQLSGINDDAHATYTIVSQFVDVDGQVAPVFRSWIGLASANLDTQLADIDNYLDTEISAIKAKTDNLPSDPADQSAVESAITAAVANLATSTEVAAVSAVTTKLNTALVADGLVYQFTANALELTPSGGGGGSSTVLVYPLNASMPIKSTGPNLTFYKDESGVVVGPIQVSARSGNAVTPVDLSGRTLEVRFVDYLGNELLTVAAADITVSGSANDQFEFEITTDVTGTTTEDHVDQYHYWSLRDLTSGDNVLVAGRARVLLS